MKKERIQFREKRIRDYEGLLRKYGNNPELAKAFQEFIEYQGQMELLRDDLVIENIKLIQERKKEKDRIKFFRHEVGTWLGSTRGLTQLLQSSYDDLDENYKKELIGDILTTSEKAICLSHFLYSKESIPKENFSIQDIALENARVFENDIIKSEKPIGIDIMYQTKYGRPLEIYSQKVDFEAILGTLLTNSLSWTPELSRIREAFRIDKANNLEILFENKKSEKKLREFGMGKGYGTEMIKEIVNDLGGEFHNYNKTQIVTKEYQNYYDQIKKFGSKKAIQDIQKGDEVFGTIITIPMKNLSKQ